VRDSAYVEKDTVVNGINYKKIVTPYPLSVFKGALLREDVTTGKVWYKGLAIVSDHSDTLEQLAYDFSLNTGDTFTIDNSSFPGPYTDTVDSVKIINNHKYIYFRHSRHPNSTYGTETYTFIEGIGSNLGVLDKYDGYMLMQYLLCAYKDGQLETSFINKKYQGSCNPPLAIDNPHAKDNAISIFPNPAMDLVQVKAKGAAINKVQIVSFDGRIIQEKNGKFLHEIPLVNISPGCYIIVIYTDNGMPVKNTLLIQRPY
jgi:hypothetical protein